MAPIKFKLTHVLALLIALFLACEPSISLPNGQSTQKTEVVPFGGDPTGTVDSTRAFQDAILYLKQNRGGILHIPCGSYLLSSQTNSAAILIDVPNISLIGDNQSCVNLNYKGNGVAIVFQMYPFTILPAGEIKNLTLNGTPQGKVAIKTGAIIGATFQNINVREFSNGTAFEIDDEKSIAPPQGPWTERNVWVNVSEWKNKVGFHLQSVGHPENNSFGYNEFFSLYMNVSTDQVGFWLDKDSYLYNGSLRAICNADDEQSGTNGPVCVKVSGNWRNETVALTGEYSASNKKPPMDAYSVQIDPSGAMTGWGSVSVDGAKVKNLRRASFTPTARLQGNLETWDSGTFNLSGSSTTPQIAFGGRAGTAGILVGENMESPFVTMYKFSGNKFVVGTTAYESPIGDMIPVWSVDDVGNVSVSSNEVVKGVANVGSGVQLSTHGTRPACGPATRGRIWQTFAQSEREDDRLDLCQRLKGKYQWVSH